MRLTIAEDLLHCTTNLSTVKGPTAASLGVKHCDSDDSVRSCDVMQSESFAVSPMSGPAKASGTAQLSMLMTV